jgi:outer membrane lipoprotein-sorting protein/peroxiredoxin
LKLRVAWSRLEKLSITGTKRMKTLRSERTRREPLAWVATLAILLGLMCAGCKQAEPAAEKAEKKGEKKAAAAQKTASGSLEELSAPDEGQASGPQPTDREILAKMVDAYKKAKSYVDKGVLDLRMTSGGQPANESADYSVAFARPDKLRMHVFSGVVVDDGKQFHAFSKEFLGEYVECAATAKLTLRAIFDDGLLGRSMFSGPTQGYSMVPVQLVLLLANDPLKTLLHDAKDPELLEPTKIGEFMCYRVRAVRPDGAVVFWIDQKSFILRRLELPSDEVRRGAEESSPNRKIEQFSMALEFTGAAFDQENDPQTFQFERDPEAQARAYLVDLPLTLLGKPAADFAFVGMDGKPVDLKTLAGKTTLLEFWSTEISRSLPMIERVRKKLNNDKVAFYAVSVDKPSVDNKDIQARATEAASTLPILRDPEEHAFKKFRVRGIPCRWVIGPSGTFDYYELGLNPKSDVGLGENLELLLAGKQSDLIKKTTQSLEDERKRYHVWLDQWLAQELFVGPGREEAPPTPVAPASKPRMLSLKPLWQLTDLKDPGNLLVVSQGNDKPPTLLVLEGSRNVAEIGLDGKVVATHPLDIAEIEAVTFLRTATDKAGKRYYAASAPGQQRVHVFDEQWKKLFSYPENALKPEASHAGIVDAQWADLDQDGTPELYVSYFGDVGVQRVSLENKQVWAFRNLSNVYKLAVLSPDSQGRHVLGAVDGNFGSLVLLNAEGKKVDEFSDPKRVLTWIAADDINNDKKPQLCGLYPPDPTVYGSSAVGLGPKGEETWTYPLPKGVFARPVEQVVPGRLSVEGPGHWLFPAADGSIHILGSDGKPIDQFCYGKTIAGLAGFIADKRPLLVIAGVELPDDSKTPGEAKKNAAKKTILEAFQVQWPTK